MRLPPSRRMDLLEFIGATPVADLQLEQLIDMMSSPAASDDRLPRGEGTMPLHKTFRVRPVSLN